MRPIHTTLPLAFIPLFVCLPNMSVPILHFFGGYVVRDSINLCASVLLCGIGAYAYFTAPVGRRLNRHLHLLFIWITLSFVSGMYLSPSTNNAMFYIQTILPLFALLYGCLLIRSPEDVPQVIRISILTTNVVILLLYLIVLVSIGPMLFVTDRMRTMYELEYGIPQFKSYYPICVQFTFGLALAQYLFGKSYKHSGVLISLVIHVAFVALCWSRAGLLGFALTGFIQCFFAMLFGKGATRQRTVVIAIVLVGAFSAVMLNLGTTIGSREDVLDQGNASDEKRLNLIAEGLQRCAERPLFGDQFIPAWDQREGGLVVDVERLFGSHNQYVDLALRGGFMYLLLFVALVYKALLCGVRLTRVPQKQGSDHFVVLGVAGCSFLISIAAQCNFQLYFIQLLTAVPCMMLIGMLFQADRLAQLDCALLRSVDAVQRQSRWNASKPIQGIPVRQKVAHGSVWARAR